MTVAINVSDVAHVNYYNTILGTVCCHCLEFGTGSCCRDRKMFQHWGCEFALSIGHGCYGVLFRDAIQSARGIPMFIFAIIIATYGFR